MKRSPIQRRSPLRATAPAKAEVPLLKMKKCSAKRGGCGEWYRPFRPLQKACGPQCASSMVEHRKEFERQKAAAAEKRQTRAQLEALKTIPQLKKEAQREFNRFIRGRDRLQSVACICCGRALPWISGGITGSGVDAGHYRSTGSADHLRFDERNCHAQRSDCNRYSAGRAVEYRIGLIARIGLDEVVAIECNNTPVKWTREGLRVIRDTYRAKARELEKANG